MAIAPLEEVVLLCIVRSYHKYELKSCVESLRYGDSFSTKHKSSNQHDKYAIAVIPEQMNFLSLLFNIVARRRFLTCTVNTVGLWHWWSLLLFPSPSDRPFPCCRNVPGLPWQKQSGKMLICANCFEEVDKHCHCCLRSN